jgi:multidrug efflux pump
LILFLTIGINFYLYAKIPKGFFPQQDTGRLIGFIRADQGISFQAMRDKLASFVEIVRSDPAVVHVVAFTGGGQRNRGAMFIELKPLQERKATADQIVARLRVKLAKEPGASLFLNPVQDIRIGGRISDATYQFTLQADDLQELRTWAPRLEQALRSVPQLADVNSDQEVRGLQTTLIIDREAAARYGLSPRQIDSTLNLAFGQAVVSTIYRELNQYRVVLEVAPPYWQSPEALAGVWLVSPTRGMVALSSIARWETTNAPLAVNHQSQFVASTISFNLPEKVSLSQATAAVQEAMARIGMPATIHGNFQGTARAFTASLESQPWLILAALVAVYVVLGILYESLVHPITILSTLPSAGVGALLALWAFGKDFNIIALIGVILLVGIVKKNAIMMIDFAVHFERGGKPPQEAIFEACLLRFRPIMMTTMAALLGALPLAVGFGYGSELRQPLGISIMGGLVLSQLLTLYSTPVVYLYLDRLRLRFSKKPLDQLKTA